jgi:hypothetical protein
MISVALACAACRQDMHDQPRYKEQGFSDFFDDHRAARPSVAGTVARGRLFEDELLHTGKLNGALSDVFPFEITRSVLERGRERYGIFCTPCHDSTGDGDGMIVQRGLKRPPSFHIPRLREAQPGYFFDVITHGFGAMFDYSDRIRAEDRWAIVAWVRVLQRAQNATLSDVPESERARLAESH